MIFKNARLICPDGIRDHLEIIESGGKICDIRGAGLYVDHDGLDLKGNYLAPGFLDLHVHGALRHDTMDGTAQSFRAICDYHASGGTTSLLLTTATAAWPDIFRVLAAVIASSSELQQIAGVHVEGPFISKDKAGAQNPEWIRHPDRAQLDALLEFPAVIKRMTLAPELPGALEAIEQLCAQHVIVSGGHSDAWDEEARAAYERGMRTVTHTFNCMSSTRRRDAQRVGGLLEFALSRPEIMCEVIADGHHVSATLLRLLYQAKGAGGIFLATDATAGAGLPNESRFFLAGQECVVDGGACWLTDHSALAGSSSRMIDLVRTMVQQAEVPLHEAVTMATANPARVL